MAKSIGDFLKNFSEYYFLNIIVNIDSFCDLNITVSTTLKYKQIKRSLSTDQIFRLVCTVFNLVIAIYMNRASAIFTDLLFYKQSEPVQLLKELLIKRGFTKEKILLLWCFPAFKPSALMTIFQPYISNIFQIDFISTILIDRLYSFPL